MTTKSGTNALHGTGYYYFRGDQFDSNTYFNEDFRTERGLTPLPKPSNDQDQFGFNLGGPILKEKLFFFADYEGTRVTRGTTLHSATPSSFAAPRNFRTWAGAEPCRHAAVGTSACRTTHRPACLSPVTSRTAP